MRIGKLRIALLVLFCGVAAAVGWRYLRVRASLPAPSQRTNPNHIPSPAYALLPESETTTYAEVFLGDPKAPVQSWEPTVADIEGLEANLFQITSLGENAPGLTRHIDDPTQYYRQYVAIEQAGKQRIFVNALCSIPADDSGKWRKHLELAADGGSCFWQAFYDPATQRFSGLRINGVG
jgi:hypothetical protein